MRKLYSYFFRTKKGKYSFLPNTLFDNKEASNAIYQLLVSDKPCMIARYGAFELSTVINYLGVHTDRFSYLDYIKGNGPELWWNHKTLAFMQSNAGFFPSTEETASRFSRLMIEDTDYLDIIGSWKKEEKFLVDSSKVISIPLLYLEPYHSPTPWTRALRDKRVLVVHPFAELIKEQYKKRKVLFDNPDILPDFDLVTFPAVQSIGGGCKSFNNWFDALDYMKSQIDNVDFDICLLGCGAYGFPLAAHIKRSGRKAIHMGGALQLMFGIKGRRWENPRYADIWGIKPSDFYLKLLDHQGWCRPTDYKVKNSDTVENSCYW